VGTRAGIHQDGNHGGNGNPAGPLRWEVKQNAGCGRMIALFGNLAPQGLGCDYWIGRSPFL
jgi:hypothetical protein